MFRNHLKVALRTVRREKVYTFVNVFGLAAGVTCCVLFALFARHEWSYDRFHADADRIFRAWGREDWGDGRTFFYTMTAIPLAEALETSIPEVEESVRIRPVDVLVGPPDRRFNEEVRMVDESFFDVFDFEPIAGSLGFPDPNSVVLTPEIARKYFAGEDPVGRVLPMEIGGRTEEFVVRGIVEAPPPTSSIQYSLLLPFTKARDLLGEGAFTNWFSIGVETYVKLEAGASAREVEAKLPAMVRGILGEEAERSGYELGLQPITDIHLNTDFPQGIEPVSDPAYSYFLMGVAVLVLVIASINFVTLSIGQSARRSGEVGVRKALGAARSQLTRQFWGEAMLVAALAVLLGIAMARLALPLFNDLSGRPLSMSIDAVSAGFLVLLILTVGTLAGVYPAFVLSSFRPIEALRGRVQVGGDRSTLRKTLVVVQFSISIFLIAGTLFVVRQLEYLRHRDLGFDKEQVVVLRTGQDGPTAARLANRMRDALGGWTEVQAVAYSAFPMDAGWARLGFDTDDGAYAEFTSNVISPEFLSTMGIEVIAGRDFSPDRTLDSTAVIVNDAFVREFGFGTPAEALGKRLPSVSFGEHEIIGVVPDFNYESLHTPVRPLVLAQSGQWLFQGASDVNVSSSTSPELSIRIGSEDVPAAMDVLQETWAEISGGRPFDFYFLDEALDSRYRQEERLSRIVGAGSTLAILIACMGLFALAALTVIRRQKEIGVRKVLGASVPSILLLLTRDFAGLVGIAFLLSTPLAYVLISRWLENFAFRVEVTASTFVMAGLITLSLSLVAVSYQSIRAAFSDPVDSLRYE